MKAIQIEIESELKRRASERRVGNLLVITVGSEISGDINSEDSFKSWVSLSFNKDKKFVIVSIPHEVGEEINLLLKEASKFYIDEVIIFKYNSEPVQFEKEIDFEKFNYKEMSYRILK